MVAIGFHGILLNWYFHGISHPADSSMGGFNQYYRFSEATRLEGGGGVLCVLADLLHQNLHWFNHT